jgi:dolichol-phosphate mannosyltransferase
VADALTCEIRTARPAEIAPARPRATLAVVIPCYRVARHLGDVLARIGPEVSAIYCVDDACPDGSWTVAQEALANDPRIRLIHHARNLGVGGAVISGYRQALAEGADVVVKLDGDGQMAPEDILKLVDPVLRGQADYVKGNRFFCLEDLRSMPWTRLVGNAGLSFLSKLSCGYWNLFDPTNGFTAIHAAALSALPLEKIDRGYFFESDMLFRLNSLRAVVAEVSIEARYGDERSNLSVRQALLRFPVCHMRNFAKRLFYNYFLRDFNVASINLLIGLLLVMFGVTFGSVHWIRGYQLDVLATPGTVMLAALPIVLGWQALLSFVHLDVTNVPRQPIQQTLEPQRRRHAPAIRR